MKTLLLDIGGVLYLSQPDDAFWRRWAFEVGWTADALQAGFWHGPDIELTNIGRMAEAEYVSRTAIRLGLGDDVVRTMLRGAFASRFNIEFAAYVRGVRDRGHPVSALTNNWSTERQLMARPELAGLFDAVISSCDVGLSKPDPAIYELAMNRLGRRADEVVFVDDTPVCVEAAARLGIPTVRFETTAQAIADIEEQLAAA